MIIDTSALMAILKREPEWEEFGRKIYNADLCLMSAGSWVELGAVTSRNADQDVHRRLGVLMQQTGIKLESVTPNQAKIGHNAYLEFGKGNHNARLNFGDCFAYALAKETGLPLLFKGNDFSQTDIVSAR